MISWCAYCQKFLGEKPPLEDRSFSHGMCKACAERGLSLTDTQYSRIEYLVDLNRRFWSAGQAEDHHEIIKLAEEGVSQGLRPIDILFGIAGPLLYKVGECWAQNRLTYMDEQRFTRSCETLIGHVAQRISQSSDLAVDAKDGTQRQTVLLTNVEGNIHTLGLQFASIGLASLGITSKIIFPSLKPEDLLSLVLRENIQVIGLSMALASQSLDLERILAVFKNEKSFNGKIIVGGAAISTYLVKQSDYPNVKLLPSPCFDEDEREFWVYKRSATAMK